MDNNLKEEFDQDSGRAQEHAWILNDNLNNAADNLQLNSSDREDPSISRKEGYGEDVEDDNNLSYTPADNSKSTPNAYKKLQGQ
jgi:hypothetical protein